MAIALSVSGSPTLTVWKRRVSAGSFSKYWRYSAQVVAAMVRSRPRASAGLSRLAASPVPAAPPAPIRVWASSMNRMIGLGEDFDLVDHLAQALLELALHAGAGLHQADVERAQRHVVQRAAARRRRRCGGRSPRPRRSCRRPASPVRIGLFWRRRSRMSMHLADLGVAADDAVDLAPCARARSGRRSIWPAPRPSRRRRGAALA